MDGVAETKDLCPPLRVEQRPAILVRVVDDSGVGQAKGEVPRAFPLPFLPRGLACATMPGAFLEVNGLLTLMAGVFMVEFVRENFFLCPALRAFAGEGRQALECLESGAMLGC